MGLTKRYKRSENLIYHDCFDRLILQSPILNAGSKNLGISTVIWSKSNILSELYLLTGDESGKVISGRDTRLAKIPYLKEKIEAVEQEFTKLNLTRELHGMRLLEVEEMPIELKAKRLEAEAELDVALSEENYLRERLKKGEILEEQKRESEMLKYGLRCNVQLKDGLIDLIDGQRVEYLDGKPIICDPASPYHGMSVQNYRAMADQWLSERRQAEAEKFQRLCKEYQEKGLPVPNMPKVSSIKEIDKSSLPKFPAWAVNHYEKTEAK